MASVTITIVTNEGRIDIQEMTGPRGNAAIAMAKAAGRAMGALRPEADEAAIAVKMIHQAVRDAGLLPRDTEPQE